jgi:hypothetical protein
MSEGARPYRRAHVSTKTMAAKSARPGGSGAHYAALKGLLTLLLLLPLAVVAPLGLATGAGAAPTRAPATGPLPGSEDLMTPEAQAGLQVVPGVELDGVSCFSKQMCVAVGSEGGFSGIPGTEGAYVTITDGVPGPVETVADTFEFTSVDCVSATTCYVAGTAFYRNPPEQATTEGAVVRIVNDSVTSVQGIAPPNFGPGVAGAITLYGIACSSVSACITAGYSAVNGGFAVDASNGVPGQAQKFLLTGPYNANGIECVTNGWCMVNAETIGGKRDNGVAGLDETVKIARHEKLAEGSSGGENNTTLGGGSCHGDDIDFCLIAGSEGAHGVPLMGGHGLVDVAVGITSTRDVAVATTHYLSDVSCANAFWCIAAGQSDSGEGVLVPIGWETPRSPVLVTGTSEFSGVSCVTNGLCTAVGEAPGGAAIDSFGVRTGQ